MRKNIKNVKKIIKKSKKLIENQKNIGKTCFWSQYLLKTSFLFAEGSNVLCIKYRHNL